MVGEWDRKTGDRTRVSESWDRIYKGFVAEDLTQFWRFNHDEKPS